MNRQTAAALTSGTVVILLVCLLVRTSVCASGPSAPRVFPGDDAFSRLDHEAAVRQYASALVASPAEPELYWRLARLHVAVGDINSGAERQWHYRRAEVFARSCISLDGQGLTRILTQ